MKRKISKKHLFLFLLICSLMGNVCLYMGKQRTEQKASDIAGELREEQEALAEISNEITEKEKAEIASDELSLTLETALPDIEQEIEEYRMHFIELYTSNAMEETEDRINMEEMEIDYGDNGEPATLIKYTDSSGEKLRYQLQFYGETGRCSIDYYLCKDFVLISRKTDYYSSWVLTADYSDVLYSTIENWIVIDENVYILHSDGEVEKIEKTQLKAPTLEEIEVYLEETEFSNINDFEDFHYYLFCNTNISLGTTPKVINAFIGNEGETMEAGIELYQKFMEPLRTDDHEENMELYYISPDCQLSVTREEPVRGDHMITRWSSFDGGKAQNVKEIDSRDRTYFHITKSGDAYTVVDGETFYKKEDKLYEQTGYYCVRYNEQGDVGAGYKFEYDESGESTQKMAIFDLESTEVLWTFCQGEEKCGYVWQIQGDKESGKVIFDVDNRYYYEFTYPSGETRYLGTDMHCPCYSPDGKYLVYSSPCSADWNDVDEKAVEEMERILPGIYILEVETGKTAYIKQDMNDIHRAATLDYRSFEWLDKDCFEQVMEGE